ncbi:MAG TPA: hypothetical protein VH061_09890 [Solirubrobacteraceae bacterium]|jgi:hypothetical protein|nr:hypothetical protein [Solirubrobacteraceae bacterium]
MSRFEDRLWDELVEQHGSLLLEPPATVMPRTPAAAGRLRWAARRRLPIAAFATALAGVLAALLIALGGGGAGTPAYAITANGDGTVIVTIREIVGIEGANAKLAALGVPVRVVPVEPDCPAVSTGSAPDRVSPEREHTILSPVGPAGNASVKVTPGAIPSGDTLVLGARQLDAGAIALGGALYKGPGRSCLPLVLGG